MIVKAGPFCRKALRNLLRPAANRRSNEHPPAAVERMSAHRLALRRKSSSARWICGASWDTDGDGMPDDWEGQHDLNPRDSGDGNTDRNDDDFTNLEEYLGSLVGEFPVEEN